MALQSAIQRVVAENPAWGILKVWATLRAEGLVASRKRIYALMKAMNLLLPSPCAGREPATRGHVTVPESNRRWATDLTTVWTRQDGLVAVMPVVDCGDRYCFDARVSRSQESQPVLDPVRQALLRTFATPEAVPSNLELRTDHGPQYTGGDCFAFCQEWHLDHTFAPVGRPTGNAVAERIIQTMKLECIWLRDWNSAAELQAALDVWRHKYNHQRPHQALGWLTPATKRTQNLAKATQATA
jgi:putative transposase